MLSQIFCDDICEIIRKKLHVDFIQYKLWCYDEGKWVYIWTENIKPVTCPNEKNHFIDKDFIIKTGHVKANGKIFRIEQVYHKFNTDFEIVNV